MKKAFYFGMALFVCENILGMNSYERMIGMIPDSDKDKVLQQDVREIVTTGNPESFCNVSQYVKTKFSFLDKNPMRNAFSIVFSLDDFVLSNFNATSTVYNDAYTSMKSILYSLSLPIYKTLRSSLKYEEKVSRFSQFKKPSLPHNIPFYDCNIDVNGALSLY